jgi:hypothetical protein|tara:strand:+ start:1259 stop:1498 length:240 start_codon:yes stop_codon:yes gene_type:complete
MANLMDDLAYDIHKHLMSVSTTFNGKQLVMLPITKVVEKFKRNHRTIQRRISALKDEGLICPIIKTNTFTLYHIKNLEE